MNFDPIRSLKNVCLLVRLLAIVCPDFDLTRSVNNSLRFARPPRPGQRPESENLCFSLFFLDFLAKNLIFEVPRPRRSFLPSESSWNLFLTDFVTKTSFFLQKSDQKMNEKLIFHHQISKTSLWPPSESIDLESSHLLVVWIPLYDQIWPIWWRKRVKNPSKWRFPTVSDTCRGFTEASRRFPILLEGLRWCPKVPSLLPRRCMLRKNWSLSVEKKVITECREKSACQERSAEVILFFF